MLQDYERMNLADALMSKKFKDGDCVINQVNVIDYKHFRKSWKKLLKKAFVWSMAEWWARELWKNADS